MGDIDTAAVISQLSIKEKGERLNLTDEVVDNLSDRLDTIELTYHFGFCDCQRWVPSDIYKKALTEHPDLGELDPRGQVVFNLQKHGYYVEAANPEIKIDWRIEVNGTTVRFIGRTYSDKRLPQDGEFTVPNPPRGNVFRYYGYQVIRPYQIWGPWKFVEVDEETGDSLSRSTILTVK